MARASSAIVYRCVTQEGQGHLVGQYSLLCETDKKDEFTLSLSIYTELFMLMQHFAWLTFFKYLP